MTDDRAVSDTLGFALTFALVASTVAIVSLTGFNALGDIKDDEQINNAERAFDVLAENLADVQEKDAPSRATEISLDDASLRLGDATEIRVRATNDVGGTGTPEFVETYEVTPIIYRSPNDAEYVYSAGSIFRDEPGEGGVVVRESPWVFDDEVVAVPIIRTTTEDSGNVLIGGTTVLVRTDGRQKTVDLANTNGRFGDASDTVKLWVNSSRADLWERQLSEYDNLDCSIPVDESVRCTVDSDLDRLYVSKTRVLVEFER